MVQVEHCNKGFVNMAPCIVKKIHTMFALITGSLSNIPVTLLLRDQQVTHHSGYLSITNPAETLSSVHLSENKFRQPRQSQILVVAILKATVDLFQINPIRLIDRQETLEEHICRVLLVLSSISSFQDSFYPVSCTRAKTEICTSLLLINISILSKTWSSFKQRRKKKGHSHSATSKAVFRV